MRGGGHQKRKLWALCAGLTALALTACSPSARFGPPRDFGMPGPVPQAPSVQTQPLAPAQGEVIGNGPVRVGLLLPLSGQTAQTGRSMVNSARLAMDHVVTTGGQNVHLVLKDTGGSAQGARSAAQQAVNEGAKLIVGPLHADAVAGAGAVARGAGIPLIGFSNTSSIAGEGVYLLSVLPEAEVMRSLSHAAAQGRRAAVALVPDNAYGHAQEAAFRQAAMEMNVAVRAVHRFANEAQARQAAQAVIPLLVSGQAQTLFIPDRATAPSFGILLEAARVPRERVLVIGSAGWNGDAAIASQPYLAGAIYPALDPAGRAALWADYTARFGSAPHPLATLAFTAVLLANNSMLSGAVPPYGPQVIASPTGFRGRDGLFRFHFDGRGEHALAIKQVRPEGAVVIEAARLGGITRAVPGAMSSAGGAIPPAAEL